MFYIYMYIYISISVVSYFAMILTQSCQSKVAKLLILFTVEYVLPVISSWHHFFFAKTYCTLASQHRNICLPYCYVRFIIFLEGENRYFKMNIKRRPFALLYILRLNEMFCHVQLFSILSYESIFYVFFLSNSNQILVGVFLRVCHIMKFYEILFCTERHFSKWKKKLLYENNIVNP